MSQIEKNRQTEERLAYFMEAIAFGEGHPYGITANFIRLRWPTMEFHPTDAALENRDIQGPAATFSLSDFVHAGTGQTAYDVWSAEVDEEPDEDSCESLCS